MENKAFKVFISLVFFVLGVWLLYKFYIYPFYNFEYKVFADPSYIFTMFLGGSIGFIISMPFLWLLYFIERKNIIKITMVVFFVVFLLFGAVSNYMIYESIIYENNLIECPNKLGYKKNIFKDYVVDIDLCDKF
ncbi:hypothetical protein ACPFTZ_003625 [Vibrio cholerae]